MPSDGSLATPEPPDPCTATDLPGLVGKLAELREWAGSPGYLKVEQLGRERGVFVSKSKVHRVLTSHQDLARMHDPEEFVRNFVTALDVDPAPWLGTLRSVLSTDSDQTELDPEPSMPRRRWHASSQLTIRAGVVAIGAMVAGLVVVWLRSGTTTAGSSIEYNRPIAVASGNTSLTMAVDRDALEPGMAVVIRLPESISPQTGWELTAPYRDNPEYWQLRPLGRQLMCLEVREGSFENGASVQQWDCNGEPHQYWKPTATQSNTAAVNLINLQSGQCLSTSALTPQAGMRLVQRPCDERQQALAWRLSPLGNEGSSPPTPTNRSISPAEVGPDPLEYPGGGKDQPCEGLETSDPESTQWTTSRFLVQDEDPQRGQTSIGRAAGTVHLFRANRISPSTPEVQETFYWAEGYVKFTPVQFSMALQWTRLPGAGGWHTCSSQFTNEHRRSTTVALPRDSDHDGNKDVWFRICMTYSSERDKSQEVSCTGRY